MRSVDVRRELVDALRLDLVGPGDGLGCDEEVLPQAPSRWYLTGFLVPLDAGPSQRTDEDSNEELDAANDAGGADDTAAPERTAARQGFLPSSMGVSILVSRETRQLTVRVRWGDYLRKPTDEPGGQDEWARRPRSEELTIPVRGPHQWRSQSGTLRAAGGLRWR
jgi:hypothetical protein